MNSLVNLFGGDRSALTRPINYVPGCLDKYGRLVVPLESVEMKGVSLSHSTQKPPMPKYRISCTCLVCKKGFYSRYKDTQFCSQRCQSVPARAKRKIIPYICPFCNSSFLGKKDQKYCSTSCKSKNLINMLPKFDLTCYYCSKAFKSHRPLARFCNKNCNTMHLKKVKREREKNNDKLMFR